MEEFLATAPADVIANGRFGHETPECFATRILRARKFDVAGAVEQAGKIAEWWTSPETRALLADTPDAALKVR